MSVACSTVMKMSQMKPALIALSAVVVLGWSQAASAEISAVINGKSYHVNSSHSWNEDNYGLGFEYRFDSRSRWHFIAMANGFRDSNSKMSYMAGGGLHRRVFQWQRLGELYVDVGLNAFLMTRRDVNDNRPFPGILPSVTVGNRHVGLNLTYLPRAATQSMVSADIVDPTVSGIFFMQVKFDIDRILPRR